jgi:hypothetical protein
MKVLLILFILLIIGVFIYKLFVNKKNKDKISHNNSKKIALCFLIYDKINHEKLWYEWLKNVDKNKYNIYIHYKENKPLKYFEKYKIKENIPTKYADISLIHAHNLLFKNALHDNNYKIISLSQSCIPVKPFDYVYNFLTNDNLAHFNKEPHSQNFPRCNKLLNYYDKKTIQKSSNWFILNRPLAESVTNTSKQKIDIMYTDIYAPEEHYFITHMYENNFLNQIKFTDNLSYATTFAAWTDYTDYKRFDKSNLSKEGPNEYDEICNEELEYLVNSKSLFARKFNENCDLQYLYKLLFI